MSEMNLKYRRTIEEMRLRFGREIMELEASCSQYTKHITNLQNENGS
jgi:hypothetical protein